VSPDDRKWVAEILLDAWASTRVVSRGVVHQADRLPGIIAVEDDERLGLLTYNIAGSSFEVVTLNSLVNRKGIGTGLIQRADEIAQKHRCSRIWVVTTNDNEDAIAFYQARGFHIVAVHKNAIEISRKLKPEIPLIGNNGILITDEIELEKTLT
jgi:GNAT superfamily N-acetyltransferase